MLSTIEHYKCWSMFQKKCFKGPLFTCLIIWFTNVLIMSHKIISFGCHYAKLSIVLYSSMSNAYLCCIFYVCSIRWLCMIINYSNIIAIDLIVGSNLTNLSNITLVCPHYLHWINRGSWGFTLQVFPQRLF